MFSRSGATGKTETLAELSRRYGSDKAPNCPIYEQYFAGLRQEPINFFEIGVGGYDDPQVGGGSLRMWKHYFPKARVFSLDIHDKRALEEDRIRIFKGSQSDAGLLRQIAAEIGRIDVILDDGSHVSSDVIRAFEVLYPLLKEGGIYIVEDVGTSYWPDHGGSYDHSAPTTSMNYFKRITDGLNHFAFKHQYSPTYADLHTQFVHFYQNFIVMQKK